MKVPSVLQWWHGRNLTCIHNINFQHHFLCCVYDSGTCGKQNICPDNLLQKLTSEFEKRIRSFFLKNEEFFSVEIEQSFCLFSCVKIKRGKKSGGQKVLSCVKKIISGDLWGQDLCFFRLSDNLKKTILKKKKNQLCNLSEKNLTKWGKKIRQNIFMKMKIWKKNIIFRFVLFLLEKKSGQHFF